MSLVDSVTFWTNRVEWLWQQYVELVDSCLVYQHDSQYGQAIRDFFAGHGANVVFLASTISSTNLHTLDLYEMTARLIDDSSLDIDTTCAEELIWTIQVAFDTYPLLQKHLHTLIHRARTGDNADNEFLLSDSISIDSLILGRRWNDATTRVVFSWFRRQINHHKKQSDALEDDAIRECVRVMTMRSGEMEYDLHNTLDSDCIYFFTHILLVLFSYGEVHRGVDLPRIHRFFSCQQHRQVIDRCCDVMRKLSKAVEMHYEAILEVGMCVLLLCQSLLQHSEKTLMDITFAKEQVDACCNLLLCDILHQHEQSLVNQCAFSREKLQSTEALVDAYHTNYLLQAFILMAARWYSVSIPSGSTSQDCIASSDMIDSTSLLQNADGLRSRMERDGYVLLRGVLPSEIITASWQTLHAHARQRYDTNTLVHDEEHRRIGGFLVNTENGYVYGDEPDTIDQQEMWKTVCTKAPLRTYILDPPKNSPFAILLRTFPSLRAQSDLTWLRVKWPGESSCVHSDYFHFLDSGTLFSHIPAFQSSQLEKSTVCYGCDEPLKNKVDNMSDYNVRCDICHAAWHGDCVAYTDLERTFEHAQEWHCRQCIHERLVVGTAFTCWMPLQSLHRDTTGGLLRIWPGTHRTTLLEHPDRKFLLPKHLTSAMLCAYPNLFPVHTPESMQPGDLILFDIRTIHAATPNTTMQSLRLSMDARLAER